MSLSICNIENIVKQHAASQTANEQHPMGAVLGCRVSGVRLVELGSLVSLALSSLSLGSLVLMVICNPGAT